MACCFAALAYLDLPSSERLVLYTHPSHSSLFLWNVNPQCHSRIIFWGCTSQLLQIHHRLQHLRKYISTNIILKDFSHSAFLFPYSKNKDPQMFWRLKLTCTVSPCFDIQLSRIKLDILKGKVGSLSGQTSATCEMFKSWLVKHSQPWLTHTSWNQKVILRHFQIRGSLMSTGQWFILLILFERL